MDWQGGSDVKGILLKPDMVKQMVKDFVKNHDSLFHSIHILRGKGSFFSYCDSVYIAAGVLWDGTVVPCCRDYNGDLALGNIHDEPFLEIWNGMNMKMLRNRLSSNKGVRLHPICNKCVFPEKAS